MQFKFLSFTLFLLLSSNSIKGQYYLFNNEPPRIELSFARHSIDATTGKTIFNILKIVNKSQQAQTFNLNLTTPTGWSVIGDEKQVVSLQPLDSILLPIRISIGDKVKGDIGYSVIAAIVDSKGNPIKNEYCFIKMPRRVDLSVKLLTRLEYIDQQTNKSHFKIKIENKGNRDELVNLTFQSDDGLGVVNENLFSYTKDININPFTDTTLTFYVFRNPNDINKREYQKLKVTFKTIDNVSNGTIWFRNLTSSFDNIINTGDKLFVAELASKGIFSEISKPIYAAYLQGKLLLKKNKEFAYYYTNDNFSNKDYIYSKNRMWIKYKSPYYEIHLGDLYSKMEGNLPGRGIGVSAKLKKIEISGMSSIGLNTQVKGQGSTIKFSSQTYGWELGGLVSQSPNYSLKSKLGIIGFQVRLFKKHSIAFKTQINDVNFRDVLNESIDKRSYGYQFGYGYNSNKVNSSITFRSGQRYLNSSYNGRSELYVNTMVKTSDNSFLFLSVIDSKSRPGDYSAPSSFIQPYVNLSKYNLLYSITLNSKVNFSFGPGFDFSSTDVFPAIKAGVDYFSTNSPNLNFNFKLNNKLLGSNLSFKVLAGKVYVNNYPKILWGDSLTTFVKKPPFNYQEFSVNLRNYKWGVQATYSNGAKSIYQQFSWFYYSNRSKVLRIMPYYDAFIYENKVKLQTSVTYSNDLIKKSSYTNITTTFFWFLPYDWTIRFLNVYSLQSRVTSSESTQRYQNIYFELAVRKELGIQQPRQRFYNLELNFFKDYNGDRVMNENESGIGNVLVNIQRVNDESSNLSFFNSQELLTNQGGKVTYEKIPNGTYTLSYNPLGNEAGSFSKDESELTIKLDKNTILYIPFVEKNKVFGKIVLNRSRLSGLGKLDVSNVRITVTDSKGRVYSTLTDKNGEFVLFAPITDQYNVNINNIYYENFDLRQNNFKVQFNGYKQFEVNFVFDEKVRRINFSPTAQDNQLAGVEQIRRTNLNGNIKDATSLKPLRARVNIINTKTNAVVNSIYSSPQNGEFTLSFLAGNDYLLEILADGYWYHSENLNLNQVTTFLNVNKEVMLKPISIGSKIELNIRFNINKTDLVAETVAELNRLLRQLRDNENIKIEVQGHSDDLEALNNPGISEERAKNVARYLIENGFSNIQIRGFGNTRPIVSNDTEQGRDANRRVEIEVMSK
ncbi:MAG: OmpA family protein [Tenuifilaceae bacterium]